ncbi:NADAR family protein [Gilliamella sp. BG1]|uniref:NADAR family protein n=1 Tax=Gilliamella sp. BG1 TaxID=3351508 RepID=UPI0039860572
MKQVGKKKMIFFFSPDHYLSQWYPCHFVINEIAFTSAEQWMMYSKALLFKDIESANAILSIPSSKMQKKLGQTVRNFDENIWNKHKKEIVFEGNYAKFSQNDELKKYLLSTKDKVLAEASPYDKIWGIGLSIDDEMRFNMTKWRGKNLLGDVLMQVRKALKA